MKFKKIKVGAVGFLMIFSSIFCFSGCDGSGFVSLFRLGMSDNVSTSDSSDTVTFSLWMQEVSTVKTFLETSDITELDFNNLTGENDANGDEITETFETQVTWANLCDNLTVDTMVVVLQIPDNNELDDISVSVTTQSSETLPDVQVLDATDLPATPDLQYEVEDGNKLVRLTVDPSFFSLLSDDESATIDVTISNVVYVDGYFTIKGIIAAIVDCDGQTYYPALVPGTTDFADVPPMKVSEEGEDYDHFLPAQDDVPDVDGALAYITAINYGEISDADDSGSDGDNSDDTADDTKGDGSDGIPCFISTLF